MVERTESRSYVQKLRNHLRSGTLGSRIATELQRWRAPKEAWRALARRALRRRWLEIEGSPSTIEVRLLGGAVVRLYGDSALGRYICCNDFESAELQFLHRYLKRGDVFVDVGANLGIFTAAAALRVGNTGRVVAFEPGADARRRLVENVQLNRADNVTISAYALSDACEVRDLTIPRAGLDAFSSLSRPIVDVAVSIERVETRTWPEAEREIGLGRSVTMMKIDVEGWELRVLRGARTLLDRSDAPLIQVEFGDSTARSAGGECADLYAFVRDLGFDWCRYDPARNRLLPDPPRDEYLYSNLFATRHLDAANRRLASGWPWSSARPVFSLRRNRSA